MIVKYGTCVYIYIIPLSSPKNKISYNHLRDHPNTEITNILFILFISKFIAENITQDHCDVILKITFALFIYLDTIRENGSVYKIYSLVST